MICPKCKKEIESKSDNIICPYCGYDLTIPMAKRTAIILLVLLVTFVLVGLFNAVDYYAQETMLEILSLLVPIGIVFSLIKYFSSIKTFVVKSLCQII